MDNPIEESRIIAAWLPLQYRKYDNESEIHNLFDYVYSGTYLSRTHDFKNTFCIVSRMGDMIGHFEIIITRHHQCEYEVYKEEVVDLVNRFTNVEKSYLMFKKFNEIAQVGKRKING